IKDNRVTEQVRRRSEYLRRGGAVVIYQPIRKRNVKTRKQLVEIAGPANRDRDVADGVLEHQVPADYPRHQFSQRRLGITVRGTGYWDDSRHLRKTKRSESANHSGNHKRKH